MMSRKPAAPDGPAPSRAPLTAHIEPEMRDVPVLHHIIATLQSELPGLTRPVLTTQPHIILIAYDLRADEALLEVGVDDACGLRGEAPLAYRPGANLLGAGGKEGLETQEREGRPHETVKAWLV